VGRCRINQIFAFPGIRGYLLPGSNGFCDHDRSVSQVRRKLVYTTHQGLVRSICTNQASLCIKRGNKYVWPESRSDTFVWSNPYFAYFMVTNQNALKPYYKIIEFARNEQSYTHFIPGMNETSIHSRGGRGRQQVLKDKDTT